MLPLTSAPHQVPDTAQLPSVEQLLVAGGDARIALDASGFDRQGVNRYGFAPLPDPGLLAFGSSTASGISSEGFAAVERVRNRLLQALQKEDADTVYARELDSVRQELVCLCGLSELPGLDVVMAASGTDAHLIASHLLATAQTFSTSEMAAKNGAARVLAIMVDAAETGSGVPLALAARHFSGRAALGAVVEEGEAIHAPGATLVASVEEKSMEVADVEVVSVAIRHGDGTPRSGVDIDAEFSDWVHKGCSGGQHVLLVLSDVSKSGMLAPSPACALALKGDFPQQLDVLVDACQFRIGVQTLRAYLQQGCMVALTGSKFLGGPPFSGALLLPHPVATRLRVHPAPRALLQYSTAADWPHGWDTHELGATANFGLLLRWEAALHELRMLRTVAEDEIEGFLDLFAHSVRQRLQLDAAFEALPVPPLERDGLGVARCWDVQQSIFPFLLLHADQTPLSCEDTKWVYLQLQRDSLKLVGTHGASRSMALRCQLGQPVACGERDGVSLSTLRLCVSARLIVGAARAGGGSTVVAQAMAVLDEVAWLAQGVRRRAVHVDT